MGSGRGDRNQLDNPGGNTPGNRKLQWGPVVVTGIRWGRPVYNDKDNHGLQWGPVVVTGISSYQIVSR